jgi:hypothetical protein
MPLLFSSQAPGPHLEHPPPKSAETRKNQSLTRPTMLWQYTGMLGELEHQFSLTRAALSTCGRAKSKFLL